MTEELEQPKQDKTVILMVVIVLLVILSLGIGLYMGYSHSNTQINEMIQAYLNINNCVCMPTP